MYNSYKSIELDNKQNSIRNTSLFSDSLVKSGKIKMKGVRKGIGFVHGCGMGRTGLFQGLRCDCGRSFCTGANCLIPNTGDGEHKISESKSEHL